MPFIAPTIELAANATWLNITSLVNSEVYSSTYGSEGEFRRSEYLHSTYAIFIAIYITLNVVFSAIGFGSFQPNINFKSKGFELCEMEPHDFHNTS
ncbi:hypothetical protein COL26b_009179 [Colletotrichum chrysophilum]|uniref:uncharacterized protein n=1 Tax=Colletotrichum chrysophilum TaxID=1836956 RepID=UPI0022FFF7AA|nr:uncharacterized protein COL26b_009179 [Colletotrichum chrysophilum]KAJ0352467.1 hypothetical protein KNSL1_002738 [Colletotrichum chrysophilum]KAJ0372257.1 hypothetical protein COL26b_009179 [Colletotrichum chrysophilum]